MIQQLFKRKKGFTFERIYPAPVDTVWRAWTDPGMLRQWWGPENTSIPECEIDLRIGGTIHVVMEAGEGMGKYQGTRWPMTGTFTTVEEPGHLAYEARSWTEGEEETSTIHHVNDLTLSRHDGGTLLRFEVAITQVGPGAKMASMGMKWGYKAHLDKLETFLAG